MFDGIRAAQRSSGSGDIDAFERDVLRYCLAFLNRVNLSLAPLLPPKDTYDSVTSHLQSWSHALAHGSDSDVTLTLPQVQKAVDTLIGKGLVGKDQGRIVFRGGWKLIKEVMTRIQPTMNDAQRTVMLRAPFETDLALLRDVADARQNAPDRLAAVTLMRDVVDRLMTLAVKRRSRVVEEEAAEEKRIAAQGRANKPSAA